MCGLYSSRIFGVNASCWLLVFIYAKNKIIIKKRELYIKYFIYNYNILKFNIENIDYNYR